MSYRSPLKQHHINSLITQHKQQFKAGHTFSLDEFCTMFSIPKLVPNPTSKDVVQHNLALVAMQTFINRKITQYGLYMRSRDYYSEFYLIYKKDVNKKVGQLYNQAGKKSHIGSQLAMGFAQHNGNLPKHLT